MTGFQYKSSTSSRTLWDPYHQSDQGEEGPEGHGRSSCSGDIFCLMSLFYSLSLPPWPLFPFPSLASSHLPLNKIDTFSYYLVCTLIQAEASLSNWIITQGISTSSGMESWMGCRMDLLWCDPQSFRERTYFTFMLLENLLWHVGEHLLLLWPWCLQECFSDIFKLLSHSCCVGVEFCGGFDWFLFFYNFINMLSQRQPPLSLIISALTSSKSVLELVGIGFVQQRGSPSSLLIEATTASPLLPKGQVFLYFVWTIHFKSLSFSKGQKFQPPSEIF